MASESAQVVATLLNAIRASRIVSYVAIGSSTVLLVDFLHTFSDEVRLMWPSPRSIPKFLFFAIRYYSLVHVVFTGAYYLGIGLTGDACLRPYIRTAISSLVLGVIAETITYVRVWAFSGQNRFVLIFLVALFIATHIVQWFFATKFTRSLGYVDFPLDARLGCIPARGQTQYLTYVFAAILSSLSCATAIMVYIAYSRGKATGSFNGLMKLFYTDGILYFISLSTLAATNIVVIQTGPANGQHLALVQAEVHLISILAARMLMHLREWAQKDPADRGVYGLHIHDPTDLSGGMQFAEPPPEVKTGDGTAISMATLSHTSEESARERDLARIFAKRFGGYVE